jgi:predicted nucleotidyltransferase
MGTGAVNPSRQELLQQIVRRIVAEVDPEQIVLFGSWARDEEGPDSDVDLLVVEPDGFGPNRSRRAELTRVWNALSSIALPVDVLVFSRDEVERWRGGINHVIARAFREGKILYDRR